MSINQQIALFLLTVFALIVMRFQIVKTVGVMMDLFPSVPTA